MATLITIPTRRITRDMIANARAEALFVSPLSRFADTDEDAVHTAISHAIANLHTAGCAEAVAQAYGDCPETAAARMTWARTLVARTYG